MPDSLISPDGKYYWDGQRWVSMQPSADAPLVQPVQQPFIQAAQPAAQQLPPKFSDDRQWWWNGTEWVPAAQAPAPLPAPQFAQPAPSGSVSRRMAATGVGAAGLAFQLGGPAAWSIGFGVASIAAPLFTNFYFPIMPIFGLLNAVRAFQRGRVAGGAIGIVLNIIGGVMSLIASGLVG